MKEQITLRELACYLPYEIKAYGSTMLIPKIHGATNEIIFFQWPNGRGTISYADFHKDWRLLLRPLSDLTKEIEHNGERFVPLQKLTEIFGGREIKFDGGAFYNTVHRGFEFKDKRGEWGRVVGTTFKEKQFDEVPMHFSQYDAFQKLLEWHFDLHNLLERGLAIDLNTRI